MIQTIIRATRILEIISQNKEGITLSEIAKGMNLGLSTVHNFLRTLLECGYVEQDEKTRKYYLGIKNYLLGSKYEESNTLLPIVQPFLINLNERFNENIIISVIRNYKLIVLKTVQSSRELIANPHYISGRLHCTGTGKLLLAYLSKEETDRCIKNQGLKKFTPKTISTREGLDEELKKIRQRGYAIAEEEGAHGISAIGVPIYNANGKVIASVGMSLPTLRFKGKRKKEIIRTLCQAGKEVSRKLVNR